MTPMLFFSGVFFPLDNFPGWMKNIRRIPAPDPRGPHLARGLHRRTRGRARLEPGRARGLRGGHLHGLHSHDAQKTHQIGAPHGTTASPRRCRRGFDRTSPPHRPVRGEHRPRRSGQGHGRGQGPGTDGPARQPDRDAVRHPVDAARAPAPGPGPVPRREAPGRRRQDARARHPRRPHGPDRAAGRPPGRGAGGTASRGRISDDPRPRRRGPAELHGPRLRSRRPPDLYEQRRRKHQGLRRRPGRDRRAFAHVPPAPRGRTPAGRGDSGGAGRHARRQAALRLRQPVQPPPRARHGDRRGPADLRRGCRAFRRRPRRRQGLRQQLGRAPADAGRSHRTGGTGHGGPGRPGEAHRQRGFRQRHRPCGRGPEDRGPRPAPRLGPGPVARRPLGRLRQCRLGQPQRHRHGDRYGRRDDLGEVESGRPLRRLAQRPGLFPGREDALCRQRHPERRRRHQVQAAPAEVQSERAYSRRLVPGRAGVERAARHPLCRQHQGARGRARGIRAVRGPGLQLLHVPRLGLLLPGAAAETALGPDRDRRHQLPPRADAPSPAEAEARPAGPARPRADRRAERLQARRLYHQGEPDLRPGPRRRRRGQRRPRALHLRRKGDAQPAQARPRLRPPRQHLLQRHPQRRRAPVVDDGLRHRLPRAVLCGMAPELSRRHGLRRDRRPGLCAERLHLGQRPEARHLTLEFRGVHDADLRLEGPRARRAPRGGRITGTNTSTAAARSRSAAPRPFPRSPPSPRPTRSDGTWTSPTSGGPAIS